MKPIHKILVGSLAAAGGGLALWLRRSLPTTQGTRQVAGLAGPVEVLRDRWGVPHVYAGSDEDLFFGQGFVHAQDRLWQMELQRRLAAGRLAELVGQPALEIDRFFRVLGVYRVAQAEESQLAGESRRILEAYVAGVNAGIEAQRGRWPLEFLLLGCRPEPWRPADSLVWIKVMAWSLDCNWESELLRARLAAHLGPDLAADLEPPYPAGGPVLAAGEGRAEGIEPPPNGWGSRALHRAMAAATGLLATGGEARPGEPPPGLAQVQGNSNQWVLNGERSATGQPLLANDTHLRLQLPATWYQNHLSGGGYHVTGVSLPGFPGVAVGHNEECAWGITIAWIDNQDLYAERFDAGEPRRYEYRGEWVMAEVRREEIRVKGQAAPEVETVTVTRHGPIISGLVRETTPLALRWSALDPHDPIASTLALNRAGTWDQFRTAMADWHSPSLNFVYADRAGNIGHVQTGCVPLRAPGDGLAPMEGWSGEHEWQGFLPAAGLPRAFNPAGGWLATANNLVVDESYPHYLSSDLENPARARRIAEHLGPAGRLSVDDCARLQLDCYSPQAHRLAALALAVEPGDERERQALDILRAWNGELRAEEVAPTICQVLRLGALHLVFDGHLGPLAGPYVGLGLTALGETGPYGDRSIVRLLNLLGAEGDDPWLRDPDSGTMRTRQAILHQALHEALDLLAGELGPDMERWTWGRYNQFHFGHLLGAARPLNLIFNRGPYPASGGQDTLLRASGTQKFPPGPAAVGAALRFVADVSDWEACRWVIAGGQAGQPLNRHYADQIGPWLAGELLPMPFARDQVERAAVRRLELLPRS